MKVRIQTIIGWMFLTFTILLANSADNKLVIVFLFFPVA